MVLTESGDVLLWGKSFYGPKVDSPVHTDLKANRITAVTTCNVLCGNVLTELVFAFTDLQEFMLCAANRCNVDTQILAASIPCSVAGVVSITSVGSLLIALDRNGKVYHANCHVWCQDVLSTGNTALPPDLPRALGSTIRSLSSKKSLVPSFTWKECTLPDNARRVEATLDTLFFITTIGDICSWTPISGKAIKRHSELDDIIAVDVACGMQHAAVLSDEGVVLTCGAGFAGQLGQGTFESVWKFCPVPLTKDLEVTTISCGSACTAVLTSCGMVCATGIVLT